MKSGCCRRRGLIYTPTIKQKRREKKHILSQKERLYIGRRVMTTERGRGVLLPKRIPKILPIFYVICTIIAYMLAHDRRWIIIPQGICCRAFTNINAIIILNLFIQTRVVFCVRLSSVLHLTISPKDVQHSCNITVKNYKITIYIIKF